MTRTAFSGSTARRRLRAAALAGLLSVSLAACSGLTGDDGDDGGTDSAGSDGENVTIRFSYLWAGEEGAAVEELIEEFNASQDRITVEGTSSPDQQQQVLSMSSSNGQFDISNTGGSQIALWSEQGIIQPLDEFIEADDYALDDFLQPVIDNNTSADGNLYALPVATNTYQLLYNTTVLQESGFDGPPETFSEWAEQIHAMSVAGADGALTRVGGIPQVDMMLLAEAWGGRWYDENKQPTPTDPANIAALEWWQQTVVDEYGADNLQTFISGFGEYGTAQWPLYTGSVPTMVDGNWQSAFIRNVAPDLEWGAAPLPYPDGEPDLQGSTRLEMSNLFIPSNSEHPEEAWEFLKFLVEGEHMRDFTVALANLPARLSLLDDPAYDELENFDVFLDALDNPNLHVLPTTSWGAEYTADLTVAFESIAAGTTDPATALAQVADLAAEYATE